MKICIISFDFWEYDAHIVEALRKKGIEANHIDIGKVTYLNIKERFINFLSKTFFKKNLKEIKRQDFIISQLNKLGHQDQILVVAPHSIEISTLEQIKKSTDRLITFLYDNLERFPVQDKLHFFDKIFSFDDYDVEKHGFEKLTNYNYLSYLPQEKQTPENDVLYITSYDKKRVKQIIELAKKFKSLNLKFKNFILIKKIWRKPLDRILLKDIIHFQFERIPHSKLPQYYQSTKVILDLMRHNQYGLSFRVFEAMALEKKIITDNEKIKEYDFYNPNNILILNEKLDNISIEFFQTPYEKLPQNVYQKYTIDEWVNRVFNL